LPSRDSTVVGMGGDNRARTARTAGSTPECAAFDADPAMTFLEWAVDAVNRLVDAHGGPIPVDADLKAGMLGRIDLNVLAYMRHMRALRFPVEATDCAVTYVGAGTWCCHYPRHEVRSGHTDLDREGHRATWREE
jgi:hypothetical protein